MNELHYIVGGYPDLTVGPSNGAVHFSHFYLDGDLISLELTQTNKITGGTNVVLPALFALPYRGYVGQDVTMRYVKNDPMLSHIVSLLIHGITPKAPQLTQMPQEFCYSVLRLEKFEALLDGYRVVSPELAHQDQHSLHLSSSAVLDLTHPSVLLPPVGTDGDTFREVFYEDSPMVRGSVDGELCVAFPQIVSIPSRLRERHL